MSFKEKSTWIILIALLVTMGGYGLTVLASGREAAADLQVIASRLKEGANPLALFAEPASP